MSPQIPQNYSTDVEAAPPPGRHAPAGLLHPPLWGFYSHRDAAPEGLGHFFRKRTEEKRKGAERLLKMQNQDHVTVLCRRCMIWGKIQDAREAAMVLERSLSQALLDLPAMGSTSRLWSL
ncbi:ferritin light chain-like [Molossus nigricans]